MDAARPMLPLPTNQDLVVKTKGRAEEAATPVCQSTATEAVKISAAKTPAMRKCQKLQQPS
jgi:hypothetical protein